MKVVILAGGLGSRLSEETLIKPKPMVEIGNMPILWHIMKNYYAQGYNDFYICAGYKQQMIKDFFYNYFLYNTDICFDFTSDQQVITYNNQIEKWKITVIDTGLETNTAGRLKRIQKYLGNEDFMLTYGDGLSDVDFNNIITLHQKTSAIVTLTAIQPKPRFGFLQIASDNSRVLNFQEKKLIDAGWINGGFMVIKSDFFTFPITDETPLEEVLSYWAEHDKLNCYKHYGFWQCMDTLKEKELLQELWDSNKAPWKAW